MKHKLLLIAALLGGSFVGLWLLMPVRKPAVRAAPIPIEPVALVAEPVLKPAPVVVPERALVSPPTPGSRSNAVELSAPPLAALSATQLVAELEELSGTSGAITPEQAERIKQILAALVQGGAASVPAIAGFLGKNLEVSYADVPGGEQLGYSSLRAGLIDSLRQIGGPEAQAALFQTLQTTALPSELLELSKDLDRQAPGQYRQQILSSAREALDMYAGNQLGTNTEIGPVFRVLQTYGEATQGGIADSARNDPQSFFSAVALANLPDGQGLPALVQMAGNSSADASGKAIATEMLAQLAGQSSDAVDALMQLAQNGQIGNGVWVQLAPILGGDQYQLAGGGSPSADANAEPASGQSYAVIDAATSPDQINQRIGLIDKFLGLVPGDSSAAAALQHARGVLQGKLAN